MHSEPRQIYKIEPFLKKWRLALIFEKGKNRFHTVVDYYSWSIWFNILWKVLRRTDVILPMIKFFLLGNRSNLDHLVLEFNKHKQYWHFMDFIDYWFLPKTLKFNLTFCQTTLKICSYNLFKYTEIVSATFAICDLYPTNSHVLLWQNIPCFNLLAANMATKVVLKSDFLLPKKIFCLL